MKGLLFTYLMTYGGAAVALFNPFYGLLVYICFAIIRPESLWFWSVPAGHYSRIVAIAMLIGWAARGFGNWRLGQAKWVVGCFFGFWIWSFLSGVLAPNLEVSTNFIEMLTKIFLPFLVGITTIDSTDKLKKLAWVILLSQGYVAFEMNQAYLSGWNRMYYNSFGGLDNNGQAITMNTALGLAFFMGFYEKSWLKKGVAWFFGVMMMHAIFFSFSRGGMLALVITGGVAFFLIEKTPKHYVVLLLGVALGFRLAGPEVTEEFLSAFADPEERDASATSRLDMWAHCWDAMVSHPILGLGPDHWKLHANQYGWPEGKAAHSLWFEMGAELGFPGVGFLFGFYGLCLWSLWRQVLRKKRKYPELASFAQMVISSIVGFGISAQFVTLEAVEIPYYVTLLGAGTLLMKSRSQNELTHSDWEIELQQLEDEAFQSGQNPNSLASPATL